MLLCSDDGRESSLFCTSFRKIKVIKWIEKWGSGRGGNTKLIGLTSIKNSKEWKSKTFNDFIIFYFYILILMETERETGIISFAIFYQYKQWHGDCEGKGRGWDGKVKREREREIDRDTVRLLHCIVVFLLLFVGYYCCVYSIWFVGFGMMLMARTKRTPIDHFDENKLQTRKRTRKTPKIFVKKLYLVYRSDSIRNSCWMELMMPFGCTLTPC